MIHVLSLEVGPSYSAIDVVRTTSIRSHRIDKEPLQGIARNGRDQCNVVNRLIHPNI